MCYDIVLESFELLISVCILNYPQSVLTEQDQRVEEVVLDGVPPGTERLLRLGSSQDLFFEILLQRGHVSAEFVSSPTSLY